MSAHEIESEAFFQITGRQPGDAVVGCIKCGSLWFTKGKQAVVEQRGNFYQCSGRLVSIRKPVDGSQT